MFSSQFSKLLHLTSHEQKILEVLTHGQISKETTITALAKAIKIPRTTLYTAFKSLISRGLIQKTQLGKSILLTATPRNPINTLLFSESSGITTNLRSENSDIPNLTRPDFEVLYGVEKLIQVYENISDKKKERIYAIQPNASMLSAVQKLSPEKLISINKKIRDNEVIFESIIHADYLKKYLNQYQTEIKTEGGNNKSKILESLEKRMSDQSFIDAKYFNTNTELLLSRDELYLINWQDESCILIRNKQMIAFAKEMFMFVKSNATKVNYHDYIGKFVGV